MGNMRVVAVYTNGDGTPVTILESKSVDTSESRGLGSLQFERYTEKDFPLGRLIDCEI